MKRLMVAVGCAVALAASPAAAVERAAGTQAAKPAAGPTKTVKGTVTAVAGSSITVKVDGEDKTYNIDGSTRIVAPGGTTKTDIARKSGQPGPTAADVLKAGQAVQVTYHENGMHASVVRTIASVPAPKAPAADAAEPKAKTQTASGVVSAVSGSSLTVKGTGGEWTFQVDPKTTVSGRGLGTAGREITAAGGKTTLTEFVHEGDTVTVTYRDVGGTKQASLVRITRKKA